MDVISNLPLGIIETILCLLPIHEAVRTSILSREWRYRWITIPKLVFIENTFQVSTNGAELSVLEQTSDKPSETERVARRCKLFDAIDHVLSIHEGPIHEFTLCMQVDHSCVELEGIISHLSNIITIKRLKLDFKHGGMVGSYGLPNSVYSLHQLTDMYVSNCGLYHERSFGELGCLTTLYLDEICADEKILVSLLSSCPLLKRKYLFLDGVCFSHKYGLPFLALLIRSSPNLEKLKLKMYPGYFLEEDDIGSFTLEDYFDIRLEHLNELEILYFSDSDNELDFVRLILATSPVLKNVRIFTHRLFHVDENSQIPIILLCTPWVSPVVKIELISN